ncbi:uncharacterized protein LOC143285260 [Babylonia areolata]|uniref:uncharacterized protein LOC143285260 n=1 Tax=Babylonia areolata TaxID=304850 RepID=UPI003FD30CB6
MALTSSGSTSYGPTTLLPPLPKFNGTCVPIQYPCYPGTRYIDPCDCKFYFLCRNTGSIVRLSCSRGTAYDHTTSQSFCQRMSDVVDSGKCDQQLPWERCQDRHGIAASRLQTLQNWCSSSGYLTPPPPKRSGGDDDQNVGAIVALVIILLLIAVVTVLIVIYVRKKGNPLAKLKDTNCWRNLDWCWREVICCESDGTGYYYDDDNNDYNENGEGEGGGAGGGNNNGDVERQQVGRDSTVRGSRRSSAFTAAQTSANEKEGMEEGEKEEEEEDGGTYHDFGGGEEKMELRTSRRRSQRNAIAEGLHAEAAAAAAVYDNPAFDPNMPFHDDDDPPPPDTEHSPAPPAYSQHGLRRMDKDADLIETTFDIEVDESEEGKRRSLRNNQSRRSVSFNRQVTTSFSRSQSTPTFGHLRRGDDGDDSDASSYVA